MGSGVQGEPLICGRCVRQTGRFPLDIRRPMLFFLQLFSTSFLSEIKTPRPPAGHVSAGRVGDSPRLSPAGRATVEMRWQPSHRTEEVHELGRTLRA